MTEQFAFEATGDFDALLERVERGEEVVITRRGKPVAKVAPLPADVSPDRQAARAAAERITELSKGLTLGGISIRELIDEGRKY